MKTMKTMKRRYEHPHLRIIELNTAIPLLAGSGGEGGHGDGPGEQDI